MDEGGNAEKVRRRGAGCPAVPGAGSPATHPWLPRGRPSVSIMCAGGGADGGVGGLRLSRVDGVLGERAARRGREEKRRREERRDGL